MRDYKILTGFLIFTLVILTPLLFLKKHLTAPKCPAHIPVTLYSNTEGRIHRLDLEEYLTGVVAAEMPAEFAAEALKAQAVAARTIAIRRLKRYGGHGCRHCPEADFCEDPSENQAWLSEADLKKKWGAADFARYKWKIKRAVYETAGEVMTYHNIPIDAVFHSTCGVGTAAAGEIWNHNVPYLQSESCGFDLQSSRLRGSFSFTWKELSRLLKTPEAALFKMKVAQRSPRGRVLWLTLGKQWIRGEDFRKIIGLTSTCFSWKANRSGVYFTVIGYGHGVGMCQYGADGMARHGFRYHQILRHYYRGIRFRRIKY